MNLKPKKIYVAGHRGMVGSSIVKNLMGRGDTNIITRNHKDLDLIDEKQFASLLLIILAAVSLMNLRKSE